MAQHPDYVAGMQELSQALDCLPSNALYRIGQLLAVHPSKKIMQVLASRTDLISDMIVNVITGAAIGVIWTELESRGYVPPEEPCQAPP